VAGFAIVTICRMEAVHSNDSGRYLKFCFAKIVPRFLIMFLWNMLFMCILDP